MSDYFYLIGSLRNPVVPIVSKQLREAGIQVFDDWYAAGERADDHWRDYEQARGRTYIEALSGLAAGHVFNFDLEHLRQCRGGILVLPAGKSGHLELGYLLGSGRPGYILLDNPDRWDVMYKFATAVVLTVPELVRAIWQSEPATAESNVVATLSTQMVIASNPGSGSLDQFETYKFLQAVDHLTDPSCPEN